MEESTEKSKAEQKRFFNWLLRLQQYAVEEARRRKRMHEVKVGDRVYAPFYGYGTVTAIHNGCMYPIIVTWDEGEHKNTVFTRDGDALKCEQDPRFKITLVDTDLKQIDERRNSRMEERTKNQVSAFKVGDIVHSPALGIGVVTDVDASESEYPITVVWTEDSNNVGKYNYTLEGHYYSHCVDANKDIELLAAATEEEGTVEEDKIKTDDAVNPSHYQVAGIPEAIGIMQGLLTKEQFEGFLWGNILKYAYRYGRKGDKKETAGKIEWYAQKLKELVQ